LAIAERAKGELLNETEGYVKFYNIKLITNREGKKINISKDGAIGIVDKEGRMIERHAVPYAAEIKVNEGDFVKDICVLHAANRREWRYNTGSMW
jgi:DNA-directed RNA polymerase subunit beta'